MKRVGLVLGQGVLLLAVSGISSPAKGPPRPDGAPTKLTITSRGLMIKGKLGSYCLPVGAGAQVCADALFDPTPTRGRLPVKGRARLVIRTGAAARLVTLQPIRAKRDATEPEFTNGSLRARPLGASRQRWVVKLPTDLRGANLVNVFVRYSFGDASFGARVRTDGACASSP